MIANRFYIRHEVAKNLKNSPLKILRTEKIDVNRQMKSENLEKNIDQFMTFPVSLVGKLVKSADNMLNYLIKKLRFLA